MVVITVCLIAIFATLVGYLIYQQQELRATDRRVNALLRELDEQTAEIKAARLVLASALKQNQDLRQEVDHHVSTILMLMEELERVS